MTVRVSHSDSLIVSETQSEFLVVLNDTAYNWCSGSGLKQLSVVQFPVSVLGQDAERSPGVLGQLQSSLMLHLIEP